MTLFVLREGFVVVGDATQDTSDWMVWTLKRCAIVRRWGTTAGFGELAMKGPLPETILDPLPDGWQISKADIKMSGPCNEKKWAKWKP